MLAMSGHRMKYCKGCVIFRFEVACTQEGYEMQKYGGKTSSIELIGQLSETTISHAPSLENFHDYSEVFHKYLEPLDHMMITYG